jgi:hypothetical protein
MMAMRRMDVWGRPDFRGVRHAGILGRLGGQFTEGRSGAQPYFLKVAYVFFQEKRSPRQFRRCLKNRTHFTSFRIGGWDWGRPAFLHQTLTMS